jgi:hypothetical protein
MRALLAVVAAGEIATGLLLLASPLVGVRLFFAAEVAGIGLVVTRLAGIALIGLGLVCWPGQQTQRDLRPARRGLVVYSALVAALLARFGWTADATGMLLWPAVALHGVFVLLLVRPVPAS